MKIALVFSILIVACSATLPPEYDCLPVDYEGSTEWMITPNKLILEPMRGDFVGNLIVSITDTDSIRQLTGTMTGKFKAPIGDSSFTRIGSMELFGVLTFANGEYSTILDVVSGTEGFTDVTGYIELIWREEDELIYFVGTLCF